jgi:hypothetical protein
MKYLTFLVFTVIALFGTIVTCVRDTDNPASWALLGLFVGTVILIAIEVLSIPKTRK